MDATGVGPDAGQVWADLMEGNRRFVAGTPRARDFVRAREALAESQQPKAVVLACSDSRVAPEIVFDQSLGDLFVIRVAANVADALAIGSIEYGVHIVGIPLLVVLGHQRCAGVKVACSGEKVDSPNMKALIRTIRNALAIAAPLHLEEELRRAEKDNVRAVARSLLDRSEVLHRRATQGTLSVIGAHYMLDTGVVERL